jgi:hypothetical protein
VDPQKSTHELCTSRLSRRLTSFLRATM